MSVIFFHFGSGPISILYQATCLTSKEKINLKMGGGNIGDGPNTVSESTVSDTELGEFFGCGPVALTEFRSFRPII